MEARKGFEPLHSGFADRRVTTSPPRPSVYSFRPRIEWINEGACHDAEYVADCRFSTRPFPFSSPIVGSGAPPDSVRIDRAAVASLITELRADERRDLNGVFVSIDGATALEEYFNGEGPDTLHDMRSAGKSITSLAVGIAIDRKLIRGVDVPLTTLLPEPAAPDKARITLEDVLTMRSGLDADDEVAESAGNEDKMDRAPDWLTFALKVPMKDTPGRTYTYSSVNAFLAGAVVERASGGPLDVFATKYLFEPLGITKTEWRRGPNNRTAGQGNLRMRLRDMARIGEMVLHEGEIGTGDGCAG